MAKFFCFSSRRRHTRCLSDWSSDVCSSDLKHAIIHTYPAGDLTFVTASHKTMYGALNSSWKREKGRFTLEIAVPANTSATVWVPAKDAAAVTESGRKPAEVKGVKFVRSQAGSAIFEVESGVYTFRSSL